jgi:hypothetical protein
MSRAPEILTLSGRAGWKSIPFAQRLFYGSAIVVLLSGITIAVWRVHGFLVGCQNESPLGPRNAPGCFDPLGYNNHLPFRLAIVGIALFIAVALIFVGRVVTKGAGESPETGPSLS